MAAQVSSQLAFVLQSGNLGSEQEALDQFVEAFMSIMFDPAMVTDEKSIVRPAVSSMLLRVDWLAGALPKSKVPQASLPFSTNPRPITRAFNPCCCGLPHADVPPVICAERLLFLDADQA